jgi:hypothetical protein
LFITFTATDALANTARKLGAVIEDGTEHKKRDGLLKDFRNDLNTVLKGQTFRFTTDVHSAYRDPNDAKLETIEQILRVQPTYVYVSESKKIP